MGNLGIRRPMIKTQLTLYMTNRPGELARVTKAFAAAEINIDGISVAEITDVGLVQLIVSDAGLARQILKKAEIPFFEQRVAVLTLPNKPGALAAVASRLAEHDVNINYLYATTSPLGSGDDCTMVISADDLEKVEALWKK